MSIIENFKNLEEAAELDRIDVQKLSDDLSKFKRFSKEEIAANQNSFRKQLERVGPKLLDHINHEKERLDDSNAKLLAVALRSFRESIPASFNIFNKRLVGELESTTRELMRKASAIEKENKQEAVESNIEKKIIESLANNTQNLSKLDLKTENQRKFTTIEGQLEPIESVLRLKVPETFSDQNIPSSIQYLNKYAISQGYKTIGSISNASGRAYVGRMEIKDGTNEYIVPFPKNEIISGQTPNILNNFRYYAGKTMNAWNDFVEAENKLVSFVEKIETPEKRVEYISEQLKEMTIGTFCAQILATLTYYYLYVPLENFMKFNHKDYNGTRQSFFERYNVSNQLSKNPLLLRREDGRWIAEKLIVTRDPVILWREIETDNRFIGMRNAMNRLNFETLTKYYDLKLAEAKTFFSSMGTIEEAYGESLESHKIVNIKKRKFVIPSMFSNPEIIQILEKINKKKEEEENWELSWGSDKIMCHDYVWQYKL